MELMIWAGGRWRRVCASTGRVAGWRRRARFVCGRRGALREMPSVVAALRSIVKGPRLPKQRCEVKPKPPTFAVPYNRYGPNVMAQIPALRKDACIQTDTESIQTDTHKSIQTQPQKLASQNDKENQFSTSQENKENHNTRTPQKRLRSASTEIIEARPFKQQKVDKSEANNKHKASHEFNRKLDNKILKPHENDVQKLVEYNSGSTDEKVIKDKNAKTKKKLNRSVNDKETEQLLRRDSTESEEQFKELVINEEDVLLLRRYIETHNTNIDLLKYDEDDSYKTMIFFKINPLVRLERCTRIARMLKNRDSNITVHFARQLGLQTVNEGYTHDKKPMKTKYRYAKALAMTRSAELPTKKNDKPVISLSDDSESDYERNKKKKRYFKEKPSSSNEDSTDTGYSRSLSCSDSDLVEIRRSNRINFSDSVQASKPREIRSRSAKEMTKSSETNVGMGRHKDRELRRKKSDVNENLQNSKDDKITSKTRNVTVTDNDTLKKLTKQNAISTDQGRQMRLKKPFIVFNSQEPLRMKIVNADNQKKEFHEPKNKHGDTESEKLKDKNKHKETDNPKLKDNKKPTFRRRMVVPKRSSVPPGREYSMLEDQAIVAWISTCTDRERAVNGNRVWRELQDSYVNLTGQKRSWHSLRNRYLRYILPSLGSLALPASHAQRLRAHASLGELKSRKKLRRNSVFDLPVVRSASARIRARPPPSPTKDDDNRRRPLPSSSKDIDIRSRPPLAKKKDAQARLTKKPESQTATSSTESQAKSSSPKKKLAPREKKILRSSLQMTKTPTENLRSKSHNKLENKQTSPRKSPTKSVSTRSPSKASNRWKVSASPTYSELTRRLLRDRSTPLPSPQRQQPAPAATNHKRRLFNPLRPTSSGSPATSQ
ncbi:hypothetical protein O0L34_g19155 [Tuta absoluta]|nr:hypothetical protein O0L34_g19155 [Tuta absoluta]